MTERQIQDGLCAYLRKNGLSFIRHRMDKKSGIASGFPDFTVIHFGKAWLCELKTEKGKLSEKQKQIISELQKNGNTVTIARNVEEAVNAVQAWLGIEKPAGEAVERGESASLTSSDAIHSTVEKEQEKPPFAIACWDGTNYVMAKSKDKPGYEMLRVATAADVLAFPKV